MKVQNMKRFSQTDRSATAMFVASPKGQHDSPSVDVAEWASRINSVWAHGTTCTLELAKVVHTARRKLPHGEWTRLWKSYRVGFSKRKAEMLVVIGRSLNNLNAQTIAHLPAGWSILYRLALLDRATLEREIEAATIHPAMTLLQAKDLLAKFRGEPAHNHSRRRSVKQRLQTLDEFLASTLADWSSEDLELAEPELTRFAEAVRAEAQQRLARTSQPEHPSFTTPFAFAG